MSLRIILFQVSFLSAGLLGGCSTVSDPETDRRTIESFVADPSKEDENKARTAAERLSRHADVAGIPRDRLVLAAFLEATGEPVRALEQLKSIPDDLPDAKTAAAARLSEGRIALYRTRQARRAEASLKSAARLDPGSHLAWAPLADLYDIQTRRTERDACFAKLDEASALDRNRLLKWTCDRPLDAEAAENVQILNAFVDADPADFESGLSLAEDAIRRGDFTAAEAVLNKIDTASDPKTAAAVELRRAMIAIDQGNFAESAEISKSIDTASIDSDSAGIHFRLLGRIALQGRDETAAEHALHRALKAAPYDREAHQLLVQTLRLAGHTREAEPVLKRLTAIDRLEDLGQKVRASLRRDDPGTLRAIADTAIELGRYALAKAWLRQLLAKDPLNDQLQQEIYRIDQLAKAGK